jgi:GT2 family glycosyltransferase
MALIKYIGDEEKTIMLNGNKKLLSKGQIFSGPSHLAKYKDFTVLGVSTNEKNPTEDVVTIDEFYVQSPNIEFIRENGRPVVSICIVTKNSHEIIKKCLERIFTYNTYQQVEILICDTGTTDSKVFELYDFYEKQFQNVKIYKDHKYNFSRNNNFLAEQAQGDVLLFLNNDVFFTYDVIPKMVKYINCSNIGCVGHRLVWEAEQDEIQHDGQVIFDRKTGQWIGPGHHNYHVKIQNAPSDNTVVEGVTAACLMVRKALFFKAGRFDEAYKDIYQDVDFNLKIYKLGYDNFVIRDNTLIHIDHGSRKSDGTADSPDDFKRLIGTWMSKGPMKVRPRVTYSILICATREDQLRKFHESIRSREPYQFIFVNNTKNYMYSAQALNTLQEVSSGEILMYTHQDVYFKSSEPFSKITKIINRLGNNFGIIGPAGVQYNGGHNMKGVDFSSKDYTFDAMKVHTLDEFCLITKRSNNLKFGEYLDHFHFYGADICYTAIDKGLRNYVVGIDLIHNSGGDGNLKNGDGYERYREQAKKFYIKWLSKYPLIGTTTARFSNGYIYYFLGHSLGLYPVDELIDMDTKQSQIKTKQEEVPTDRWL